MAHMNHTYLGAQSTQIGPASGYWESQDNHWLRVVDAYDQPGLLLFAVGIASEVQGNLLFRTSDSIQIRFVTCPMTLHGALRSFAS